MEENKRHWRIGSKSEYIGCEVLPNMKDIEYVVIDHIEFKDRLSVQGSTKENMWVCYFKKNEYFDRPMLLNSTNRRRLCKLAKNQYPESIKDFPVRLTSELCRDPQGDGQTEGLRFSKIPARAPKKESLTVGSEKFEKCRTALKNGYTIEQMKAKYEISKDVEKELLK